MGTWVKKGKDINALLNEAAQIDPYIGEALEGTGPFEDGLHLAHVVADICWNPQDDIHGKWIDQVIEISIFSVTWKRKGAQIMSGQHIVYGSKAPGFSLTWQAEVERLPQGPREWGPHAPEVVYDLMLTLTKDKSKPPVKKIAESLGWELISG